MYKVDLVGKRFGKLVVIWEKNNHGSGARIWECRCDCGKIIFESTSNLRRRKSCGCLRVQPKVRGSQHGNWRGGRRIKKGYICVYSPRHPNSTKSNYVLEHVLVMSDHIGRPLEKGEVVHHINGIKTDNRIENLELCTITNHFKGQRVSDMIKFCLEYLKKYSPEVLK